eukprot:jgi/Mesvir1/15931/Mv08254-RA.1
MSRTTTAPPGPRPRHEPNMRASTTHGHRPYKTSVEDPERDGTSPAAPSPSTSTSPSLPPWKRPPMSQSSIRQAMDSGMEFARAASAGRGQRVPGRFMRSASFVGSLDSAVEGRTAALERSVKQATQRCEEAENLALDLARRLRDAEARASQAEKEKAAVAEQLGALRKHISHKFSVSYGRVEDDSDSYEGFLQGSIPTWWGTCRFTNGDVYQWVRGGYHGQGTYCYANGDTFEGTWQNDVREGAGVFTEASGVAWDHWYTDGNLTAKSMRNPGGPGARVPGASSRATSAANGAAAQADAASHQRTWQAFEANPPAVLRFVDIPWPARDDSWAALLVGKLAGEERRKAYKELLRRWHPDKWQGRNLHEPDRAQILEGVAVIFQNVKRAMEKEKLS